MAPGRPPRNNILGDWLARWIGPATASRSPDNPRAEPAASAGLESDLLLRLRENERVWSGFRSLEIELLSARTLHELFRAITEFLPQRFPSIDQISVSWLDPEYELTRFLNNTDPGLARRVIGLRGFDSEQQLPRDQPRLGPLTPGLQHLLFPHSAHPLGSVAIVPLRLHGEWVGTLNQASRDAGHYAPGMATDLLEHLALVFALCVENALNRVRLQRDGLTDSLTGVANRRFFERRLQEEVSQWLRHGGYLSCLLVDIDHFKEINDRHGHPAGDRVLQQVAQALSQGLRASDVLARHGGEEFVLLLPATDTIRAREIAERLRVEIARITPEIPAPKSATVTVSIGVAALEPAQRSRLEDPGLWLIRRADEVLYQAKAQGRNRVVLSESLVGGVSTTVETPKSNQGTT